MARGSTFTIDASQIGRLSDALASYGSDAEKAINDVLHNEAGDMAQEAIYRLMPRSDKRKGKHAKDSKSLTNVFGNLSVTVTTTKKFNYLYFPDDGSNTRRHVGNQRFFERGGETVADDIVERCISKLIENFESEV